MPTAKEMSAIILLIFSGTLGLPVVFLTGYQLYDKWNAQWLIKRRRTIILIMFICTVYRILIDATFWGLAELLKIDNEILLQLVRQCGFLTMLTFFHLIGMRIWLLYYDHQYGNVLATTKWKILLDPNIQSKDWYLKNRHRRYGDEIWLIKYIAIPTISIYMIFYNIVYYTRKKRADKEIVSQTFSMTAFVLLLIFGGIYWRKYPKFQDVFKVRAELKISFVTAGIFVIVAVATIIILIAIYGTVFYYILLAASLGWCWILYLMIIYPQRTMTNNISIRKLDENKDIDLIYWSQVTETKDGYEAFANFLEKEFSIENILFITEYVQFKQIVMGKDELYEKIKNDLGLTFNVKLPESIPLSEIANEFNENMIEQSFYKCTYKLYCKYIDPSKAMLEVNISSDIRRELINIFGNEITFNKIIENILPLMETAVKEISYLMNHSYSRFKKENVFTELKRIASMTNE